jgi:hypothetical protein
MSTNKQTYDSDEEFAQALLGLITQRAQDKAQGQKSDKLDLNLKFTVHYAKDSSSGARAPAPQVCCICVNDGGIIICRGLGSDPCC